MEYLIKKDYTNRDSNEIAQELVNASSEEEFEKMLNILQEREYYGDYDDIPQYTGGRNERAYWLMYDEIPDDITGVDPQRLQDILNSNDPYIEYPEA